MKGEERRKNSGIFPVLLEQIAFVGGKNGGSVGTQERNILEIIWRLTFNSLAKVPPETGLLLEDRIFRSCFRLSSPFIFYLLSAGL